MRRIVVGLGLTLALAACAPKLDGPTAQQRTEDSREGERLAAQLAALPGVVRTEVVLRRAVRDPLSTGAPSPSALSAVIVVDDRADRVTITSQATRLATAIAPELTPALVVEVGAIRPQLATLGPFHVEARSRGALKAVLAIVLALVAALASVLAWQQYRIIR